MSLKITLANKKRCKHMHDGVTHFDFVDQTFNSFNLWM